ncbi:MAG: hypothetical protein Q7R52_01760 [archaeon]|nr:hypothetical protein [archaeon]
MEHNHTSHMWMMLIACGGALLLILILPIIGLSKNWSVGISIVVMIGSHFWMMRGNSCQDNNHKKHKGGIK